MKVVFVRTPTEYGKIKPGDVFFYHGDAFLKAADTGMTKSNLSLNVSTGEVHYFSDEVMVNPADCELHVLSM